MNCRACYQQFSNEKGYRPRILINCGHSQCQTCIETSLPKQKIVCSQCGHETQGSMINNFPINGTLLSMIKQGMTIQSYIQPGDELKDMCSIHHKKLQAYCQKDNQLLCLSCVIGTQHKSHKIVPIGQKVQKDRNILKDCFKKIMNSKEQIEEIRGMLEEGLECLEHEYKDTLLEISLTFNHIRQLIKETQEKCLQKCKNEYQLAMSKSEAKLQEIEDKIKFYSELEYIYEEIIILPNIQYLNEDAKRIFLVQNCKFKKPKNSAINEFLSQNKLIYNKLTSYNQLISSIQELVSFQKKVQSQGTPTLKSKKGKFSGTGFSTREPAVLEVNLNEQYRKHVKQGSTDTQSPLLFNKLKTSLSNCENGQISDRNNSKKMSKSFRGSKIYENRSGSRRTKQEKKEEAEEEQEKSMISLQSDLSGFIPASAVNSFMGNSQITLNQLSSYQHNQSMSLSIKDTDAEYTLISSWERIYHFGSFSSATFQIMKIEENSKLVPEKMKPENEKGEIKRSKAQSIILESYNPSKCLIIGGKSPSDIKLQNILQFDLITHQATQSVFKLSQAKSGFGCVTKNGKIFIAGGSNNHKSLKSFEEYKIGPTGLTKTDYPMMNFSRDQLGMVLGHDGFIYACGGINELGTVLNSFERYNWEKSKWEMLPNMNRPRRCFSLVSLPHGIYAIGGYDGNQYLSQVEFYEFNSKKWMSSPPMIRARFAHTSLATNDMQHIIVCGGFNKHPLKQTQIFNVLQNRWVMGADLNEQRFLHSSVLIS